MHQAEVNRNRVRRRASPPRTTVTSKRHDKTDLAAYWLTILLLVGVPLSFSTAVYRMYSLPKFVLLLSGSTGLVPLLAWSAMIAYRRGYAPWRSLASRQVLLVSLFALTIAVSTILGVAPIASLFGSLYNQMGLITHLCFFILFVSLIVVNGKSETRFRGTLWAMTLTGLVVATYAFMQFFGRDPFLQPQFYTFESQAGPILRVNSTIGHSNYLGNFLLYVTPLGIGLALGSRGRARRIGFMAAGLSTAAIVFTGTRGAWVGLVAAALSLGVLTRQRARATLVEHADRRQIIRWVGVALVVIVLLSVIVAMTPASRTIVQRARSLIHESTGSGRTLLWRDSMKMVTEYAVVGCGPEGFRKAFLPYKSTSLAQDAPSTNNESSHNSYIDAALSYGLPGAILYVAIIVSSFSLLLRARRRATENDTRIILESLVSSLAAVVVHNLFIFDQISTGLYFFAFAALAQTATHLVAREDQGQTGGIVVSETAEDRLKDAATKSPITIQGRDRDSAQPLASPTLLSRLAAFLFATGCAIFLIATWYCFGIVRGDFEINKALLSAKSGDLSGVLVHGDRAISQPDPAGDYHFLLARTLAFYLDNSIEESPQSRDLALRMAMSHAKQSLRHTNTPDSSYLLLAYFALQLGQYEEVLAYASEANSRDPNSSNAHWLMAEAYLARDEREQAAHEAQLALFLNPNLRVARSALKRARGIPLPTDGPDNFIRYAQKLASEGKIEKARLLLLRALRKADGHCADCHRALALLYESTNRHQEAVSEWKAYALEAPERALIEKTALRIERLQRQAMREH